MMKLGLLGLALVAKIGNSYYDYPYYQDNEGDLSAYSYDQDYDYEYDYDYNYEEGDAYYLNEIAMDELSEDDMDMATYNYVSQNADDVDSNYYGHHHGGVCRGDRLYVNQVLRVDDKLCSPNGRWYAILQGDSNFVIYNKEGQAYWASGTHTRTCSRDQLKVVLQGDANVVLYCGSTAFWHTQTHGVGQPRYFVMQDDGNLVMYSDRTPTWDSQGHTKNMLLRGRD